MKQFYTFKAKSTDTAELLLYDEIGESFWGGGTSAKQFAADLKAIKGVKTLTVRINSPGGSVFDGFAIYNQLMRFDARVEVDIDGLAASIASLIALAGKEVRMAKNALYMIHDPCGMVAGTAQDMRDFADNLDKVRDNIVGVYGDRSGNDHKTLTKWMTDETWMTADEAKARGFVDVITGERDIQNHFDLSKYRYKHPPQRAPMAARGDLDERAFLAHMQQRVAALQGR